jgi:hypothetical protein
MALLGSLEGTSKHQATVARMLIASQPLANIQEALKDLLCIDQEAERKR